MVDSVMSSDAVWKRDGSGVEHPSRAAILAFIRKQCAEDEKNRIDEHLLSGCDLCNQVYTGLKQDSNLLNQLFDMSHRLYYPELQLNQVFLHMQRGVPLTSVWTGKRKRTFQMRSQSAGRYVGRRAGLLTFRFSVPFVVGVILLFTTFTIVLTYSFANIIELRSKMSSQVTTKSHSTSTQTPVIVSQPTSTATVTITPSPEPTVSPGPTLAPTIIKGAKLALCPWSQNSGWAVFICAHGFKGVSKVWLLIEYHGSNARQSSSYIVNGAGEFEAWVPMYCKGSPVTIVAVNKAQQPLTLPWVYTSKAGCFWPTPNVTPGGRP